MQVKILESLEESKIKGLFLSGEPPARPIPDDPFGSGIGIAADAEWVDAGSFFLSRCISAARFNLKVVAFFA